MALLYRWPMQDNAASRTVVETVGGANALTKVTNTSVASVAGPGGLYPLGLNINGDLNRTIATPSLSVNTTQVLSVAFWMRLTSLSAVQVFVELSANYNAASTAAFLANATGSSGGTASGVKGPQLTNFRYNNRTYTGSPPINQWAHFCYLFDFSQPFGPLATQAIQYVNNAELGIVSEINEDNTGVFFTNNPMFIGARNQAQFPVFGAYAGLHVYNHRLSPSEISALIREVTGGGRLINGGLVNGGLINRGLMR